MNFTSIDIQGSILSSDLLGKIRSEQAGFQQGKDFNSDFTNSKLKDEISLAWQEAKGQWNIFKSKLARLKDGETGTTETRNFWISPLLTNLNYNLTFNRSAEELNGKSFPIGYRDSSLDNFPVYVGGYHESLDKRPENKQFRVSPHAMLQEYLNYSEHLYGLVTNGRQLRLLRDASRITRLSYVEFNLEKMMEEDLYSDFVILYRLLHASRMPKKMDAGAESIMELYHQQGLEAGSTIRNKLGLAVKGAIKNLADGFLNHPQNIALRNALKEGNIDPDEYYHHQLRIIYRLLFLFVIEERNLVYAESKMPETKRFNQIYYDCYSLFRLRKLAKNLLSPDASRHYDLWQGLVGTFSLFEKKDIGAKLGIMSLQGDLFGYESIGNNQYDLHQCYLSNAVLLSIIKSLSYFENDNGILIGVNYGGLDVEEFGSVYEGLLELKLEFNKIEGSDNYSVTWEKQANGREFQSHYTPEELVQPLIKHSLEYLIEDILLLHTQKKANKENTIKALLGLKVCDVACGSGHILLSAARRIALAVARVQSEEEQPNPLAIRKAMKEVVRCCIYGVDKNPLAVELCKIALWLEAYNPGEPLNFLDHHIKCGDAIVGLVHRNELENGIPIEAFKTLPDDDKNISKSFRDRNAKECKERAADVSQLKADFEKTTERSVEEAMVEYKSFNQLPETTPDEIQLKSKAYKKFIGGKGVSFLKAMADIQVAQFFISKTGANKDYLLTDADFHLILTGYQGWQGRKLAKATAVASEQRFFHWFIEFPEIINDGGFDCILGNPPFLRGKDISGFYGDSYLNYIKFNYFPSIGNVDFVTYFFRRIFTICKNERFQSLIATNTISQGDTKEAGIEFICRSGGMINFATRSIKWPGKASVVVSLVTIFKGKWNRGIILNNDRVNSINTLLENGVIERAPEVLFQNQNKSFQGSVVLGKGFVLDEKQYNNFIAVDPKNADVIQKYLNGDDFNNRFDQSPSRWVINFYDWLLSPIHDTGKNDENYKGPPYAEDYKFCLEWVIKNVKPEREKLKEKNYREKWWQYGRRAVELYNSINSIKQVLVRTQASKHNGFAFINSGIVFDQKVIVFAYDSFDVFSILNSSIHEVWLWKYKVDLGDTPNYSPSKIFQTFPFPQFLSDFSKKKMQEIGEQYHEHRRLFMLKVQLGLTKTYNAFHAFGIQPDITEIIHGDLNGKEIEKKYGKEVGSLMRHLQKGKGSYNIEELVYGVLKLRELHVQMDNTVLEAYGWQDIQLCHSFYDIESLPEIDRNRFTIHPDARKEILKRLLELNHKIHNEEVNAGVWDIKSKKREEPNESDQEIGGLFK